jgi:flavocytochrome c
MYWYSSSVSHNSDRTPRGAASRASIGHYELFSILANQNILWKASVQTFEKPDEIKNSGLHMNHGVNQKIIVVGAGLAGLSATHTIMEAGGKVVLIEKGHSLFPPNNNSSSSNSGINGCCSSVQRAQKIEDSVDSFLGDITKNGPKKSDLLKILCSNSGQAVDWLVSRFGIGLVLSRSGGHTNARTHKVKDRSTGFVVVSELSKKALDIAAAENSKLEISTSSTASKLLTDDSNRVIGIEYEKNGEIHQLKGVVLICCGGFGADFNHSASIMAKYRPDLMRVSTCCDLETSVGDGIRLGEQVGARLVDMMYIQLNPTGLVDPANPANRYKAMASEAIRGDGAIIVDRFGKRFVNELSKRDFLSSEILNNPNGPFRIIANSRMARHLKSYIDEYVETGLMERFESGEELAKNMELSPEDLSANFKDYNTAAEEGHDSFGRTHFRNHPYEMTDTLYAALIEPVIQYCVGGLAVNTDSQVLAKDGKVIQGLYAAGEVAGGIHSSVPLAGNDLLDCIVFGRIAGITAAKEVYGADFVEQNTNPELIKKILLEQIAKKKEAIQNAKQSIAKVEAEIEQAKCAMRTEQKQMTELCSAVTEKHGSKHPGVAGAKFNTQGIGCNELLSVESAEAIATHLRGIRRQREAEIEAKEREFDEFNSRIEDIEKKTQSFRKAIKQKIHESKRIEKDLETIRDGSVVIKEIHQLEELIKTYKQRQETAEREKTSVLEALQMWKKEQETKLAELKQRQEATEVMIHLDKVEVKKGIELMSSLVRKFKAKVEYERENAEKINELASNKGCPIFQFPVKKRQRTVPQLDPCLSN